MLTRLSDADEASYEVSAGFRRHIPGVRATSTLNAGLTLPVRADEDWRVVYERMLRSLAENRELAALPPTVVLRALARVPFPVIRALFDLKDRRGPAVRSYGAFLIAHVGRYRLEELDGGGFTARTVYSLPIRGVAIIPVVTIVEAAGRTEIIISGDDVRGIRERARGMLDRIVELMSVRPEPAAEAIASDDRTARVVRETWARVLGVRVDDLEPSSDFHRLGGTSVLLLTVVAELSHALFDSAGEEAFVGRLGAIVRDPTLREMTDVVRRQVLGG